MILQPPAVASQVEFAWVSVCEKLLLTLNGPHPTLALPLVVEVWKWD